MPIETAIHAGNLRHRLKFYERTITKDAATGADTATWTTEFCTVWAQMNPTDGKKIFDETRSGKFTTERLTTAAIRYRKGLDETMQAEFRGRRFEVLEILDIEERRIKMMLALRELE